MKEIEQRKFRMKIQANTIRPGNVIEHADKQFRLAGLEHTEVGKER